MDEEDPILSHALESSLWEIKVRALAFITSDTIPTQLAVCTFTPYSIVFVFSLRPSRLITTQM